MVGDEENGSSEELSTKSPKSAKSTIEDGAMRGSVKIDLGKDHS